MDKQFTLTAQIIRAADTYIPITKKAAIAQIIANASIEKVEIKDAGGNVPPRYIENSYTKNLCLMGILLKLYLHLSYVQDEKSLMVDAVDYDKYAGAHIINQLERMKGDMDVRNAVFDLLSDYRELEKRVNAEIFTRLSAQNDDVARLQLLLSGLPLPEDAKKMVSEIGELQEEIDKQRKIHKSIVTDSNT